MPRFTLLTATAAAGLVLLSGCGLVGESDPEPTTTVAAPASTASTASPGTGSETPSAPPSAGVTPSAPAGAVTFATPQAAAEALIAAWNIGDKQAALKAGGPNTVEKVFAGAVNIDAKLEACNPGKDSGVSYAYDCYYRYAGGSTHFYVDPYPATKWRVVNFKQVAD